MSPLWLTILAEVSLVVAGVCAIIIAADLLAGHPQPMAVMNVVWPVTALYFGPLGLWAYYALGRKAARKAAMPARQPEPPGPKPGEGAGDRPRALDDRPGRHPGRAPSWQQVFVGSTHCGAGCTLGDIIAEWSVFWLGWTIAGSALWPSYVLDYLLAYTVGIAFQYFAIVPMRHLSPAKGVVEAIKADTLSLTAFELGMFAWMALVYLVFFHPPLHPNSPVYWFMMQIGMIVGFLTTYPANRWLIRRGIKEAM